MMKPVFYFGGYHSVEKNLLFPFSGWWRNLHMKGRDNPCKQKFKLQFFSCMFISILYMFRSTMCPSSGKLFCQLDDRLVCRSICSCIPDGHLHRVTKTRRRIDTIILLMIGTWLLETCTE